MIYRWAFLMLAVTGAASSLDAVAPPTPEGARLLTVELFSARSVKSLTVTPLGSGSTSNSDGRHAMQPMTAPLQVEWTHDGLRLPPGTTVKQLSLSGGFRLQANGAEEVQAAGRWNIARRPNGLRVLLTLPSEEYVVAALNGEAAPDEPPASLKAMAIAMRTFALVNANRHGAEGFGLCDNTHCQALRMGRTRPEVRRAGQETAGETLWFGRQRAHVYYTQHCGGMSETASSVWPAERATYLAGHRADLYCLRRSSAEWHARITLDQISRIFRAQGWRMPSPIESIGVAGRSASGRAVLLEVMGQGATARLSASSFRFAVDRALGWNQMRSDWYTTSVSSGALEIAGRGYGHGVGLCQAGAFEMAAEGHSDAEILSFYFPGTLSGITSSDHGWQKVAGAGWTLLTTDPHAGLLAEGNAAWAKAQSLLPSPARSTRPIVQELPNTELFRQTTSEPGWMLASTRGSEIFLQPAEVRRHNGGTEGLLLHEFLHVLVEQESGEQAPLWLREGMVEMLASQANGTLDSVDLTASEVDAALAHPQDFAISRRAHLAAARMTTALSARYGMPAVRGFLRDGVPPGVMKSLGPAAQR